MPTIDTQSLNPLRRLNFTSPSPDIELPAHYFMPYNPLITTNLSKTQREPSFIPPREIVTRSKTGKLKPKEFLGFRTFFATRHPLCVLSSIVIESETTCFTKTITKPEWRAAMSCEFDVLMANRT